MSSSPSTRIIRIGIIGLGEIAQLNHISALNNLSHLYQITFLCDVSQDALRHCSSRVTGSKPHTTTRAEELCASPDVDAVLICNSHAFHTPHTILALQNDKYVLCEKPLALNYRDIDAIIAAEKKSKGKVFVGYQRRYAAVFLDAVEMVGGLDEILYARVRDISGYKNFFIAQSGVYPKTFTDVSKHEIDDLNSRTDEAVREALNDYGVEATERNKDMVPWLAGMGSHDLSAMRELIGMPKKVLGAHLDPRFWSVIFQYEGFAITYESGMNNVGVFDAHIEVYSMNKIIRVNYDAPYLKGLPVTMTIRERVEGAKHDSCQESTIRKTDEDPYVLEFIEFHDCVVNGKAVKTTPEDSRQDLDLFSMIMRAGQ